ncbi:hypothetical protein ACFFRR_008785 [Megaselia abdita]
MEVRVIEKSDITYYNNQNGTGKRAEIVAEHDEKGLVKLLLFNKVVDLFYEDFSVGEKAEIPHYHYRSPEELEIVVDSGIKCEEISQEPFEACFVDDVFVCQAEHCSEPMNYSENQKILIMRVLTSFNR